MNKVNLVFDADPEGKEAVYRKLRLLYGTRAGEQALDRSFGLDWSGLDSPLEVAKAELTTEIIEKTASYVPEVTVASVTFSLDADGALTPTVKVKEALT